MNIQKNKEKKALLGDESVDFPQDSAVRCHLPLKICLFPLFLLLIAVTCGILLSYFLPAYQEKRIVTCKHAMDSCVITLVESIPEDLTYDGPNNYTHVPTAKALMDLINKANHSIEIASYYWTLRGTDLSYHDNTSKPGEDLFDALLKAVKVKKRVRIVQNIPTSTYPQNDTEILKAAGAEVRSLNFTQLMGNGILHTKMWMIDRRHFYVGSANLDWRSLTQVKEMGVTVTNCSCLTMDMAKIFDVYWDLALPSKKHIPRSWPQYLHTMINVNNTAGIKYNGTNGQVYLSSSPPAMCPPGRTTDIDAILDVIHKAEKFIHVAVMDYFPTSLYTNHRIYWPVIDDALREAAVNRNVTVKLIGSCWKHTRSDMAHFLQSLEAIYDLKRNVIVEVQWFTVPIYTDSQRKIPFCRVNHNKYMVTDKHAYIGTSNWSEDYFTNTGGIGFILSSDNSSSSDLRAQLERAFDRDWYSNYTSYVTKPCLVE